MSAKGPSARPVEPSLDLETDVLVIGGGPAGLWSALTARQEGARVVLVDKGFAGSSGVAAAATAGHWWVPPDPEAPEGAMLERYSVGAELSERSWMSRVLDETWRRFPEVADELAYMQLFRVGTLAAGRPTIEGPVYLRALRRRAARIGVRILDHAPALELLVDAEGAVRGASGVRPQKDEHWRVSAGAVILATGGCSYKSGSLGSNVDTGDGYLMGAEVGAQLSGMEFSNYYGIVPVGASMDKNGFYLAATFTDVDANTVAVGWSGAVGAIGPDPENASLIRAAQYGPVYAQLDRAPLEQRRGMRAGMPKYFVAFDRLGIDPFNERFEIEFIQEGTVRGTGGLRPADGTCWTGVPGLWAVGDTLSRERIVGAASGAGAANAAFTIASGTWAGRAAATHGAAGPALKAVALRPMGAVGLRPTGTPAPAGAWREFTRAAQEETLPVTKNALRSEVVVSAAQRQLDQLWRAAAATLWGGGRESLRAREAAAMIATGRWGYASALARTESRGMHVRVDRPHSDPAQRNRVLVRGIHDLAIEVEAVVDDFSTVAALA